MIKKILFALFGAISSAASAGVSMIEEGCNAVNSLVDLHAAADGAQELFHQAAHDAHHHHYQADDDGDSESDDD